MCPLGVKNGQDLAQTSRKWRKKISNGESDGERKIYPSANPDNAYFTLITELQIIFFSISMVLVEIKPVNIKILASVSAPRLTCFMDN